MTCRVQGCKADQYPGSIPFGLTLCSDHCTAFVQSLEYQRWQVYQGSERGRAALMDWVNRIEREELHREVTK